MSNINLAELPIITEGPPKEGQLILPLRTGLDLSTRENVERLAEQGYILGIGGGTLNIFGREIPIWAWHQQIKAQDGKPNDLVRYFVGERSNPLRDQAIEAGLPPENFYLSTRDLGLPRIEIGYVELSGITEQPHSHPDCDELLILTGGVLELTDAIKKRQMGRQLILDMRPDRLPVDNDQGPVKYWLDQDGQRLAASYLIPAGSNHLVTEAEEAQLIIVKTPTQNGMRNDSWARRELYQPETKVN